VFSTKPNQTADRHSCNAELTNCKVGLPMIPRPQLSCSHTKCSGHNEPYLANNLDCRGHNLTLQNSIMNAGIVCYGLGNSSVLGQNFSKAPWIWAVGPNQNLVSSATDAKLVQHSANGMRLVSPPFTVQPADSSDANQTSWSRPVLCRYASDFIAIIGPNTTHHYWLPKSQCRRQ